MKNNPSERGQAIIMIVLGFVVLLGFTALAIDGGLLYADRRYLQNGADSASLAGAGAAAGKLKVLSDAHTPGVRGDDWNCASAGVQDAIQTAFGVGGGAAFQNTGITVITQTVLTGNGNVLGIECNSAHYIDIRTSLTQDSRTSLLHFVYSGAAQNTVDAITRVYAQEPIGSGYAIISLTDECSNATDRGTWFAGNGVTTITGGGVFSNSCIRASGTAGSVDVVGGSIVYDQYNDTFIQNGQKPISPLPVGVPYDNKPVIAAPTCVGLTDQIPYTSGSNITYSPGRYTNDIHIVSNGTTVIFNPGLYCFDDGADLIINGSNISGSGVTFYFTDDAGGMNTEGMGTVLLTPPYPPCTNPPYDNSTCGPAVPNLLIYVDKLNTNPITLGGNAASTYEGTVYAPGSVIRVGGTTSAISEVAIQMIGNSVRIYGDAAVNITYDKDKTYHTNNYINLEK